MKKSGRDFAFMHCVGEYPTPTENSNLSRINELNKLHSRKENKFIFNQKR